MQAPDNLTKWDVENDYNRDNREGPTNDMKNLKYVIH